MRQGCTLSPLLFPNLIKKHVDYMAEPFDASIFVYVEMLNITRLVFVYGLERQGLAGVENYAPGCHVWPLKQHTDIYPTQK